jgi:microcystin-dependent protein
MPLFNPTRGVATGSIMPHGSTTVPTDFLLCDGSAVSRTTYSDLFGAIGTAFGIGDGSTTFNVPDMRQRFILGQAASGTGSTFAGTGGTIDHTHTATPPAATSGTPSATSPAVAVTGSVASATHTHSVTVPAFTTGPANPPFIVTIYIIRT